MPGAFAALLMLAAGCGSSPGGRGEGAGEGTDRDSGAQSDLAGACGRRVVLQTDWFPQPEHGGAYQLIGPDGKVDTNKGRYSGQIGDTGVELEIRAGGPYIGSAPVSALMYQDRDIFMGYVNTDEAVKLSAKLPTVAVLAPLDKSPQILMWNPEKFSFDSFDDIGASRAKVLHFEGSTFVDYLVGKGLLRKEQLDSSYDGSPSRFVAEGDVVQQGYATNEPYKYEHDIKAWNKPVDFLLVHRSGYETYPQNIAVRPDTVRDKGDCLKLLVPLMQQAQVDYMADPRPVNEALVKMVEDLNSSWTLSVPATDDAVTELRQLEIVTNSPEGFLGGFDLDRVRRMIEILKGIYDKQGVDSVKRDLQPDDIVTNQFLDRSVKL